MRDGGVSLL